VGVDSRGLAVRGRPQGRCLREVLLYLLTVRLSDRSIHGPIGDFNLCLDPIQLCLTSLLPPLPPLSEDTTPSAATYTTLFRFDV
jgi:hypothetical protein